MSKRIVEHDPISGITTSFEYDESNGDGRIWREQDIGWMLDHNKALANDDDITKRGIKDGWWRYAMIPNIIIEKWLNEFGVDAYNKDHEKKVFELLNRPEYKYLKTTAKMHWG